MYSPDVDNNVVSDAKLEAVVHWYQKQLLELEEKVLKWQPAEKDKYKGLARRLKDINSKIWLRNQEHEDQKIEIEKMTDIICDLRVNCCKV